MPKSYSDHERAYIVRRLKEEVTNCLVLYGIKGTTVDELVKRVKIPKGTFYLFYRSKELLIFDVLLEQHENFERQICNTIKQLDAQTITCEQMTEVIYTFYKATDDLPLFHLITTGEIEILARKLPEEILTNHFTHDTDIIEKIISVLPVSKTIDSNIFSAAFRILFMVMLMNKDSKTQNEEEALKLLIKGLVMQLM